MKQTSQPRTPVEPSKSAGSKYPAGPQPDTSQNAKVFPPDSPVDVPNLPTAPDSKKPRPDQTDISRHEPNPDQPGPAVDRSTSSWADNTNPAPDKKNARSSLF
jgi:hypothetical protein